MVKKNLKPILTPSTLKSFKQLGTKLNDSSTLTYLVQALASLRKYWTSLENKEKRLLIVSSKGTEGLLTSSNQSFQLTLREGILSGSMDVKFQFQEIPLANEDIYACQAISKMESP